MGSFRSIRLLLALICLCFSSAWADDAYDRETSGFLKNLGVIRIGITRAPGNGHQATGVLVMKRLRELGFQGSFEVYYVPEVGRKLEYLLPGFRPNGRRTQILPGTGRITLSVWHDKSRNYAKIAPRTALGIMGADDVDTLPEDLNVDGLITVNPSRWFDGPSLKISSDISSNDPPEKARVQLSEDLRDLPIHVPLPQIENTKEFLEQQMGYSPDLRKKLRGLEALLDNQPRIESLVAYGLGFEGVRKFANLLQAVHAAQLARPERFKGGVVVPLLSKFNESEWSRFRSLMSEHGEPPSWLKIQDSTENGVSEGVRDLKPSQILVMPVGSVPQDVWNLLISRSTLPPTVAGTSGVNFARQLGKPFIITVADETWATQKAVAEVEAKLPSLLGRWWGSKKREQLRDFVLDAMDPVSSLSLAFRAEGKSYERSTDKVSAVLSEAVRMLDQKLGTGQWPAVRAGKSKAIRECLVHEIQRYALKSHRRS